MPDHNDTTDNTRGFADLGPDEFDDVDPALAAEQDENLLLKAAYHPDAATAIHALADEYTARSTKAAKRLYQLEDAGEEAEVFPDVDHGPEREIDRVKARLDAFRSAASSARMAALSQEAAAGVDSDRASIPEADRNGKATPTDMMAETMGKINERSHGVITDTEASDTSSDDGTGADPDDGNEEGCGEGEGG